MYSHTLSSPIFATPRARAHVFSWVFTAFAISAPILLVIYAFASSSDAIERAQTVVGGLESTVAVLVATLALRALFGLGIKNQPARLVTEQK